MGSGFLSIVDSPSVSSTVRSRPRTCAKTESTRPDPRFHSDSTEYNVPNF